MSAPLIGFDSILDMLQWVEKQQSFDSGSQSSYRSHDANHPNIELHPSQSSGAEVRYGIGFPNP